MNISSQEASAMFTVIKTFMKWGFYLGSLLVKHLDKKILKKFLKKSLRACFPFAIMMSALKIVPTAGS